MTETNRRALLAGASAALTLPLAVPAFAQAGLSAADRAQVNKAVAYLEGLARAKGRFTQIDGRGRRSTGDFFLQRPGRVRFDYDEPNKLLVVSNGNQVAVADQRLNTYEAYALNMTPLNLFIGKQIRFDRGVEVTDVTPVQGGFSLTARDRNRETQGRITMVFSESPMRLREWTVVDAQGARTRVILDSLQPVASLDRALFVLPRDPRPRRGGSRPN